MSSRFSRSGVWLGVAAAALASLVACGQVEAEPSSGGPTSRDPLVQIAASTNMPIYYLGERFGGYRYVATVFTPGAER